MARKRTTRVRGGDCTSARGLPIDLASDPGPSIVWHFSVFRRLLPIKSVPALAKSRENHGRGGKEVCMSLLHSARISPRGILKGALQSVLHLTFLSALSDKGRYRGSVSPRAYRTVAAFFSPPSPPLFRSSLFLLMVSKNWIRLLSWRGKTRRDMSSTVPNSPSLYSAIYVRPPWTDLCVL